MQAIMPPINWPSLIFSVPIYTVLIFLSCHITLARASSMLNKTSGSGQACLIPNLGGGENIQSFPANNSAAISFFENDLY